MEGVELGEDLAAAREIQEDVIAIEHPVHAELVKLRYFAGLTLSQAAEALELSERTAGRHWAFARAWLRRAVEGDR